MRDSVVYPGSSNSVELRGLQASSGAYQNAAVVTVEDIVDGNGTSVTGLSFPLTMSYQSGSNGTYQATLSPSAGFTDGTRYTATIKAVAGSLEAVFTETVRAQLRRA